MPAYFQLLSKTTGKAETFVKIDEAMCKALGVETEPVKFYQGWYDNIGMFCALGQTWDEIRNIWKDFPELLRVIDWLEANYTSDSWR